MQRSVNLINLLLDIKKKEDISYEYEESKRQHEYVLYTLKE